LVLCQCCLIGVKEQIKKKRDTVCSHGDGEYLLKNVPCKLDKYACICSRFDHLQKSYYSQGFEFLLQFHLLLLENYYFLWCRLWLLDQCGVLFINILLRISNFKTKKKIKFVSDLWQVGGFFLDTPVSSTNNTERRDIAEILLKVTLNTITLSTNIIINGSWNSISSCLTDFLEFITFQYSLVSFVLRLLAISLWCCIFQILIQYVLCIIVLPYQLHRERPEDCFSPTFQLSVNFVWWICNLH
jgi:hypothetical protein